MTKFWLGTHQPDWLQWIKAPLFVSDRRLRRYKTYKPAACEWALDSGGFTELQQYGKWTVTPREYVDRIHRYQDEIGLLAWAAPQDWMCEDIIINGGAANGRRFVGTGLTSREHRWRTIDNYFDLLNLDSALPIIPVVQGNHADDYVEHVDWYRAVGIDLTTYPLVGVGSVCRRQGMTEAGEILRGLHAAGVTKLHGFGFKLTGLREFGNLLASADSMAWSFDARRGDLMSQCVGGTHINCANCPHYALAWREKVLTA